MLRRRPLLRAAATTAVVAGTATAVSGRVARRQQNRDQQAYEAQAYEQMQAAPPPQAPAPQPPASAGISSNAIAELKQLGELHEQGVLTDEEFAAAKAKILGS